MKLFTYAVIYGCLFMAISNSAFTQSLGLPPTTNAGGGLNGTPGKFGNPVPDSHPWTDPALNHNRLLTQRNGDGVYKLIGPYKVIGTSYLFGEHNKGDLFSKDEKGYNIFLSYNTYNQELEFYSTSNPDKPLVKEPGTLDSFVLKPDTSLGIINPLKFVYGSILGTTDKSYYEEIYIGKRFSLYKRYKSDLDYASSNYAQTELRQFDLQYEYFYTDTENKGVKKLKQNASNVIKEFKNVKDLSSVVKGDAFSANPEDVLRKAFEYLNSDQKGF